VPAKIVKLRDIPVAEEIIIHDDELISHGRRAAYNDAIAVLNFAMPKPPPAWANRYLGYLLRKLLDA
jgi:hypothetical protein